MSGHTLCTTDTKRDMTSETMENFPFLPHCARHFNVEGSHAASLPLVTDGRAQERIYRTGGQDED